MEETSPGNVVSGKGVTDLNGLIGLIRSMDERVTAVAAYQVGLFRPLRLV